MKLATVFIMCLSLGAAVIPPPSRVLVYIVTRAATVEERALLSGRLVKRNAINVHWIDNTNVVRAELPGSVLDSLRSEQDVVLVLSSEERPPAAAVPIIGPVQSEAPAAVLLAPPPASGCGTGVVPQPYPLAGQPPLGMSMGMGMTSMMDSVAGSLATRLFNRAPSCRISVKSAKAKFAGEGGDGVLEVESSGSCAWQAQSTVDWIQINSGAGVSGSGVVTYTVKAAAGKARSGAISIVAAGGGSTIKGKASLVVTQTR